MKTQSNVIENTGKPEEQSGAPIGKQATSRQFVAIVFILSLATKMFLLPIYLIQTTGRDAYIAIAIGGAVDLVALGLIVAVMYVSKQTDLFELFTRVLGKIGAKLVVGIIGLFLFLKFNIAVAEILVYYGNNVFTEFDTPIMIIILLVFLTAVGIHTLRALVRLNELLVPLIVVSLAVLTAIVLMTGFDLANIFPALRQPQAFKTGVFTHTAWLGDFTPLLLFVGRTNLKKSTGAFAVGVGGIGTAVAVFFALTLSAAFGNVSSLVDSTTNLSSILQFAIGNVYGRIDMFSSILWSISVFMEAALFFYAACRCASFCIGKKAHFAISLVAVACTYAIQIFALTDQTILLLVATSSAVSAIVPLMTFAAPIIALVCALVCSRKNSETMTGDKNDNRKKETSRI